MQFAAPIQELQSKAAELDRLREGLHQALAAGPGWRERLIELAATAPATAAVGSDQTFADQRAPLHPADTEPVKGLPPVRSVQGAPPLVRPVHGAPTQAPSWIAQVHIDSPVHRRAQRPQTPSPPARRLTEGGVLEQRRDGAGKKDKGLQVSRRPAGGSESGAAGGGPGPVGLPAHDLALVGALLREAMGKLSPATVGDRSAVTARHAAAAAALDAAPGRRAGAGSRCTGRANLSGPLASFDLWGEAAEPAPAPARGGPAAELPLPEGQTGRQETPASSESLLALDERRKACEWRAPGPGGGRAPLLPIRLNVLGETQCRTGARPPVGEGLVNQTVNPLVKRGAATAGTAPPSAAAGGRGGLASAPSFQVSCPPPPTSTIALPVPV